MDTFNWFLGLFALVLLVLGMPYVITWANMTFTRLHPVRCRAVEESELPEGLIAAARGPRDKLESLGLIYKGAIANRSICFDQEQESYSLVFLDPERRVMASLTETSYPGSLRMFEVSFYSRLREGRVLYTTDCHGHQMFRLPDNFVAQDGYSGDIEQQWHLHNSRLTHNPAVPDQWSAETFEDSNTALADWLQGCYEIFFSYWLEKRIVLRPASKVYYPNPFYLVGFTRHLIRGQKVAVSRLQNVTSSEPPANHRFLLERQLAFQRGSNAISKILLLLVSLVIFYLAFGLIFSWVLVAMLAVALFMHEYGHYLAMRYCGYRNTQIFFLPLLGAVTTGQKINPTLGQELLVYLAGPLPGILLGLGLLASPWVDTWPWIREFAIVCFILNFINLLPLIPLDGGRVVEKLLFARFAGARFGFYALSAAGFAVAAWFTRDLILGFLTVATAILAKNEWRKHGIMRRIRATHTDFFKRPPDDKRDIILSALCAENLQAGERFVFAKDLLASHSGKAPTFVAAALGMALYAGVLGGAVAGAYYGVSHGAFITDSFDDFDEDAYYSASFWREALEEETEYDGSGWHSILGAVRALSRGPNPSDATEFVQLAERFLQNVNEPDLRLAQWRLLKPDITGVPLVAADVAYIRRNILKGSAENYEKASALQSLLDARSMLKEADKIAIIEETLILLESDDSADSYIAADLYHRHGELLRLVGREGEAKTAFENGFEREIRSEYLTMQDGNYEALIDLYFAAGQYRTAATMADARLAAVIKADNTFTRAMPSEIRHTIRQQRAWFLLLADDASASGAFAELLADYEAEKRKSRRYDKSHLEHILDAIYSHETQGQDTRSFVTLLREQPQEYIDKFIRGCHCKNRGAFNTFRDEKYLETLAKLGFNVPND